MALSFPPNPSIGDTYQAPNGFTYTWDGTKWYVSSGGTSGGGGGAGSLVIKQEGVIVNSSATTLNFIGSYVTLTSTVSNVTIDIRPSPATTATLGSVVIGAGITVDVDGKISVREGLAYWAEQNNVIDNTQTAVVSLYTVGAQPNVDAAIVPKGEGANLASFGGDKRGAFATDWQKQRNSNAQVAGGAYSVISGGSFNEASKQGSTVIGGNNNTADGTYSTILGGQGGTTRGVNGAVVTPGFATGGIYANAGAMQTAVYVLGGITTNTDPIKLTTDGSPTISAANQIHAGDRSTVHFKGTVVARLNSATSETAYWQFEGIMIQDVDTTSTDFVPAGTVPVVTLVTATSTTTNWTVDLEINNILGCVSVVATAGDAQEVRWVSRVETIEITDAV